MTTFPLTRSSLSVWARWKEASEPMRGIIEASIHPHETEGLRRLRDNINRALKLDPDKRLPVVLEGLDLQEAALPSLLRALYPDACAPEAAEQAIRKHYAAAWGKPEPRKPYERRVNMHKEIEAMKAVAAPSTGFPAGRKGLTAGERYAKLSDRIADWLRDNGREDERALSPGLAAKIAEALNVHIASVGRHWDAARAQFAPPPAPKPETPAEEISMAQETEQPELKRMAPSVRAFYAELQTRQLDPAQIVPSVQLRDIAEKLDITYTAASVRLAGLRRALRIESVTRPHQSKVTTLPAAPVEAAAPIEPEAQALPASAADALANAVAEHPVAGRFVERLQSEGWDVHPTADPDVVELASPQGSMPDDPFVSEGDRQTLSEAYAVMVDPDAQMHELLTLRNQVQQLAEEAERWRTACELVNDERDRTAAELERALAERDEALAAQVKAPMIAGRELALTLALQISSKITLQSDRKLILAVTEQVLGLNGAGR